MPLLSEYQVAVLTHTALSDVPIFLLPRPTIHDSARQNKLLEKRYEEVNYLLDIGLIEDVSDEFRDYVADHIKRTGRRFKVYGLSEMGYLMFRDGLPESVN